MKKFVASHWFSQVSSTYKTDGHDITEILLKLALNSITLTLKLSSLRDIVLFTNCCALVTLLHIHRVNHIGGVMVDVLAWSMVDSWFKPRSG